MSLQKLQQHELLKHSATIHISNTLTLLERKLYNILLKNAIPHLSKSHTHTISERELRQHIGREGNTSNEIREAIERLVGTKIQWNIFGKDNKNDWGVTTILSSATMKSGICSYEYSVRLQEFLSNPNIYARLNLLVQKEFRSKHAIVLWEYLVDQLCTNKKNNIETDWISIENYRLLLGLTPNQYRSFKTLNKDIIKRTVEEINSVSDINITPTYKRKGRKIVALSFNVERKEQYIDAQATLIPQKSSETTLELIHTLNTQFGLSERKANSLVQKHEAAYIENAIMYVQAQLDKKRIDNIAAYIVSCINEGWHKNIKSSENLLFPAKSNNINYSAQIHSEEWKKIRKLLEQYLGKGVFKSWIDPILSFKKENNQVILFAHNKLTENRINSQLNHKLLSIWQRYDSSIEHIKAVVKLTN